MSKRLGKNFKVAIGGTKIQAMGKIGVPPVSTDQIEVTAMGDSWKQFMFGLKDGGELTFDGFFDPDDTNGQEALRYLNLTAANVTDLRVYIDNTSYFAPCQTTGYWSPTTTSGAPTQASYLNITKYQIGADQKGAGTISFTGKVSGCMVLI